MHDGHRVGGVAFGAGLIAQDAEGQHRNVDPTVAGDDRGHQPTVRSDVVGVELHGVHRRRPSRLHPGDLIGEPVRAAGGQYDCRPRSEPGGEFDADFAAPTEDHHCLGARVSHGLHYHLG